MSIGYACITLGIKGSKLRKCIRKNANYENLSNIISHNLNVLDNVIEYNIKNEIFLFRISSDLIPFGSSEINNIKWWDDYKEEFKAIGEKIIKSNMRVSMHPGQYTVLNSISDKVVKSAIEDLKYHTRIMDALGLDKKHKIVIHIGGVYEDKEESKKRFIENYLSLDANIKNRLIIENDDKSYNISDVLEIAKSINTPVVFDNLHNKLNPGQLKKSEKDILEECSKTWKEEDGKQKIHYSQQRTNGRQGAHSETIIANEFMEFYNELKLDNKDVMLEVKDKDLSAIKCINCTTSKGSISRLEKEWSKYKYRILESDPNVYNEIRKLLKDKKGYPYLDFYNLIEKTINSASDIGYSVNAALHVWGYFKNKSSNEEKKHFAKNIENFQKGLVSIKKIKNILWKMTIKYDEKYLIESYYFLDL